MRIDAYNQIAALYKTTKPSKAKTAAEMQQDRFLVLAGMALCGMAILVLWRRKKEAQSAE